MKKYSFLLLLFFLGTVLSLSAQDKEEKKNREKDPSSKMNDAILAADLANYGYTNKSSLALCDAALLLARSPLKDLSVEKSDASVGDNGAKNKKGVELSVDKLLADATGFANGDKIYLGLIEKVKKEVQDSAETHKVASRGRYYGAARCYRKVYGSSSYVDYIVFTGREFAEVAIAGDGDTDLDLYIYDENGNLIGSDADYSDKCYVSFYPRYTGTFKIVVKNRGNVYNNYLLMSN